MAIYGSRGGVSVGAAAIAADIFRALSIKISPPPLIALSPLHSLSVSPVANTALSAPPPRWQPLSSDAQKPLYRTNLQSLTLCVSLMLLGMSLGGLTLYGATASAARHGQPCITASG